VTHLAPETLALRALGEPAGTGEDDAHLAGCPLCRADLDQFRAVVSVARADDQPAELLTPAAGVWARIAQEAGPEAGLATEPADGGSPAAAPPVTVPPAAAPPVTVPPATGVPRRMAPWWRRPLTAGVAGLLIGAAAAAGGYELTATPGPTAGASSTLRPLPQFPRWRHARGTAVMERQAGGLAVTVTVRARPGAGFFEVWLLARDGVKMISLGDLNGSRTGVFAIPPGTSLAEYSRIDVSLQPFDGSTQHSRVSVVRGPLP